MTQSPPTAVTEAVASTDAALERLHTAIGTLTDGDLHRAGTGGGWTVAQVIAHINVCAVLWLGNLQRLETDPELRFFYREEIGHDAQDYPPPTIDIALGRLASTRRALSTALPATRPEVLERTVEIPDLGTKTIADWTPIIGGHLDSHVDQAFDIMRDRGFAPEGV